MSDPISRLQTIAWRGISFPIKDLKTSFTHDIAQHKYPGVDGARLEETGRGPLAISATCLFYNVGCSFDISANTSQPLYPDVHRQFMIACGDGSTGTLLHPEWGELDAKCVSFDTVVDASRRDGVAVQVAWLEHTDDAATLGEASPLAFATQAASDVDEALLALRLKNAALDAELRNKKIPSFSDTLRSVRATADTLTLLQRQGAGIIPRMQYDLKQTSDSLERLTDASGHTAKAAVEALKAALLAVQASLFVTRKILVFATPVDMTLGAIAGTLKVSIADLTRLNPALAGSYRVARGSVVRYPA